VKLRCIQTDVEASCGKNEEKPGKNIQGVNTLRNGRSSETTAS